MKCSHVNWAQFSQSLFSPSFILLSFPHHSFFLFNLHTHKLYCPIEKICFAHGDNHIIKPNTTTWWSCLLEVFISNQVVVWCQRLALYCDNFPLTAGRWVGLKKYWAHPFTDGQCKSMLMHVHVCVLFSALWASVWVTGGKTISSLWQDQIRTLYHVAHICFALFPWCCNQQQHTTHHHSFPQGVLRLSLSQTVELLSYSVSCVGEVESSQTVE